jgi:acetyl-CoA acetyltransferase
VSEARGKAVIAGVADACSPDGNLDLTGRALEAAMLREALDDAGLDIRDVDAVFSAGDSMGFAEYFGIQPRYTDSTQVGGSSFEVHVEHAAAAIALGLCDVAVTTYASTPHSARRRPRPQGGMPGMDPRAMRAMMGGANPAMEWEAPYGLRQPMGAYALAASRHMAVYGTTAEQLAHIAVSTREWAVMNPRARFQDPITISDVLDSPMQCSPLHLLDCCLQTDGAGAVIMTRADRAKDLRKPPAYILGVGTAHSHSMISQMPDLTEVSATVSGPKAFQMAGIKHDDVDLAMLYDSFTITTLLLLEGLGFCPKGEGGRFVEDGKLGPGGSLPCNTNGGGLSYTHPGMYGIFLLVEATRQLRGECGKRQVPDCEIAIAHGSGGVLSSMSTVVLGTEGAL